MKFINCNLCDKDDTKLAYRIDGINIVRCRHCGLIYQNPRMEEEVNGLYSEEFYNQYYGDKSKLMSSAQALIEKIANYIPDNKIRMLEIGAGLGYTLKAARDKGWDIFGTEISPFAVRYAKDKLNLKIFNGSLEEAPFADNFFDLVIIVHVLEHLPDPSKILTKIFQILKNHGVLYVVVPNIANFRAWIRKERWAYLTPQYHLYHFTPHTLKKIVVKGGFKIVHIETPQNIITAEYLTKTSIAPLSFLGEKLKNIKQHFPFILDSFRYLIGKIVPGEGITLVAEKRRC